MLMIVHLNLCTSSLDLGILIIPTHSGMVALFLNLFMGLHYLLNSLNLWFLLYRIEAVRKEHGMVYKRIEHIELSKCELSIVVLLTHSVSLKHTLSVS